MKTGLTVFVKRAHGVMHAATLQAEATHPTSKLMAARACAAAHLGKPEAVLDVEIIDEHRMIVRERERAWRWAGELLVSAAMGVSIALAVATGLLWLMDGGAK